MAVRLLETFPVWDWCAPKKITLISFRWAHSSVCGLPDLCRALPGIRNRHIDSKQAVASQFQPAKITCANLIEHTQGDPITALLSEQDTRGAKHLLPLKLRQYHRGRQKWLHNLLKGQLLASCCIFRKISLSWASSTLYLTAKELCAPTLPLVTPQDTGYLAMFNSSGFSEEKKKKKACARNTTGLPSSGCAKINSFALSRGASPERTRFYLLSCNKYSPQLSQLPPPQPASFLNLGEGSGKLLELFLLLLHEADEASGLTATF